MLLRSGRCSAFEEADFVEIVGGFGGADGGDDLGVVFGVFRLALVFEDVGEDGVDFHAAAVGGFAVGGIDGDGLACGGFGVIQFFEAAEGFGFPDEGAFFEGVAGVELVAEGGHLIGHEGEEEFVGVVFGRALVEEGEEDAFGFFVSAGGDEGFGGDGADGGVFLIKAEGHDVVERSEACHQGAFCRRMRTSSLRPAWL